MAKLNVFDDSRVQRFFSLIETTFPNSELKEAYEGYVHIHVNEGQLSLGALFRIIEGSKQEYSIENYTVSQTTLEQVFLTFARSQLDPDELRRRMHSDSRWKSKFNKCGITCC
jgi:ATP-binding cassette, subfamily A (ABC1), member 3